MNLLTKTLEDSRMQVHERKIVPTYSILVATEQSIVLQNPHPFKAGNANVGAFKKNTWFTIFPIISFCHGQQIHGRNLPYG